MIEKELVLSKEIYEKMKDKSLNGQHVKKSNKRAKISKDKLKKSIFAIMSAAVLATSSFSLAYAKENISEHVQYTKFINSNEEIVLKHKHLNSVSNSNYYYDTISIADEISTSEQDTDALIYATYVNMECNKIENMNFVIKSLRNKMPDTKYAKYSDFEDYLTQNNFIKENGEIDLEKYSNYMKSYIFAINTISDYECGQNIGGRIK